MSCFVYFSHIVAGVVCCAYLTLICGLIWFLGTSQSL